MLVYTIKNGNDLCCFHIKRENAGLEGLVKDIRQRFGYIIKLVSYPGQYSWWTFCLASL